LARPNQQPDRGSFACAVRSQHRQQFTGVHVQVEHPRSAVISPVFLGTPASDATIDSLFAFHFSLDVLIRGRTLNRGARLSIAQK